MFPLTITAVDNVLFSGDVDSVTCPGTLGELTILAKHSALITTLKEGKIIVRQGRKENNGFEEKVFDVKRGLLEVGNNKATILV